MAEKVPDRSARKVPVAFGKKRIRISEGLMSALILVCALVSVSSLLLVFGFLLGNASPFFQSYPPDQFLSGTVWDPFRPGDPTFGILPLFTATFIISLAAAVLAVPIGLGCSIYLSEMANPKVKSYLKPVIEVMAGIPSVILGLFAALILSQWIAAIFDPDSTLNALNGAIILGIMMIPIQVTISEEAMNSVPHSLREASYALGATKWETIRRVVVPAALSGIIASIVLALGRAIGETMAVLMATGNAPQFTFDLLKSMQTMTAALANEIPEAASGSIQFQGLFAVGLVLFIFTFAVNSIADVVLARYREAYR
jgi:phosphate transport system permease protein